MITKYADIQQDFNKVISYSQNFSCNSDALFEQWYNAKKDIIDTWGGNLIVESKEIVEFHLDQESKNKKINDYLDWLYHNGRHNQLREFIGMNWEGIYKNVVLQEYKLSEDKVVPKGMRLIKAFKYFIQDEQFLAHAQNKLSMIIQEDKVSGHLCISVHPLDFISSSENTYNWRSCHALDGEYRAGNLSYMVDKSTFICYLRGETQATLPRFSPEVPWNNKKWRMLLFRSEDGNHLMAGRQYPFFSKDALEVVRSLYLKSCGRKSEIYDEWTKWTNFHIDEAKLSDDPWDTVYLVDKYFCMHERLYKSKMIIKDAEGAKHYNDLLYSSCYSPYYCYTDVNGTEINPRWNIGGKVNCLHCGEHPITTGDAMACDNCITDLYQDHVQCTCCGNYFSLDVAYWIDWYDSYVCPHCMETAGHYCDKCGEWFFDVDLRCDELTGKYYCRNCEEDD